MDKIVAVIGAGKTGRGFLARLLAESSCRIRFVDRDKSLVEALRKAGSYTVRFFDGSPAQKVSGYEACTWGDACFSDVDLILVSVGGSNLRDVGERLREELADGKKRYLITAENAKRPAALLAEALEGLPVRTAESTVFCTTIEDGGLEIASQSYPYLQFDADALDWDPGIPGLKPIRGFGNFLTRKLFTYNAASCVIAYLGYLKGYTDYGEAANDPEILALLDRNYDATNRVLCQVFGYDPEDQRQFAVLSRQKFCDRTIVDTVARNAREPQRKLQPGERIMGPLMMLWEHHEDVSVLALTAAAMLLYDGEGETAWRKIRDAGTPAEILEQVAGLPAGHPVAVKICALRERLAARLRDGGEISLADLV